MLFDDMNGSAHIHTATGTRLGDYSLWKLKKVPSYTLVSELVQKYCLVVGQAVGDGTGAPQDARRDALHPNTTLRAN